MLTAPQLPPGTITAPASQLPLNPNEILPAVSPSVPSLSSLPSANAKLYLDFDGDPSRRWASWGGIGGYVTGDIPAFDTDGDPLHFSNKELEQMTQIWVVASEKFSPFNVDVTTIDPGALQDKKSAKIVIGGDGKWYGDDAAGGVAIEGGFSGNVLDNNKIGYVWDGQVSGNVRYIGESIAHEAGHIFNLQHRSDVANNVEYLPGFVMGAGEQGPGPWGRWSVGERSDRPWSLLAHADNFVSIGVQDDVAILSGPDNGFGFRPDEAGAGAAGATNMSLGDPSLQQVSGVGVISQTSDADAWRFNWSGGALALTVNVANLDPMLFARLELRDVNFNLVASASLSTQGQAIKVNALVAGTYYAVVKSRVQYGDIGGYTLLGEIDQLADNSLRTATRFGRFGQTNPILPPTTAFEGRGQFNDFVGNSDPDDFYSFVTSSVGGMFACTLYNLSGDADLELIRDYNNDGLVNGTDRIATSTNGGTSPENIGPIYLAVNTVYYIHVYKFGTANTNYNLDCFMDEAGNAPGTVSQLAPRYLQNGGGTNNYYDFVDTNDVDDYYQIDADNAGRLNLSVDQLGNDADLYLYRLNGNGTLTQVASSTNTGTTSESITNFSVTPNTYFIQVRAYTVVSANTNYHLTVDLDYAPFDNGTGNLFPSTPLPNIGLMTGEINVNDFLGPNDTYDVFKMTVPPGMLRVNQTADSIIPHKLELIYDVNGNSQVDPGDVLASGTTSLSYNVPDLSGGGLSLMFLRVSVNHPGEQSSNGNYTLKVAGANVVDVNDSIFQSQALGPGGSPSATVNGQLYWSVDDDAINDTDDYYRFTLAAPQQFIASLSGAAVPKLQLIRDDNGNGQIDSGERLAGAGTFEPYGRSSLAVNLPSGTYFLRVFILTPERVQHVVSLPYTLTTSVAAVTDTIAPTILSAVFDPNVAPHGLSVNFSEDVRDSLDLDDFLTQLLGDPSSPPPFTPKFIAYDPSTNSAGGSFGGILPDGNYRLTIPAGSIHDAAGNPLATSFTYDFFVLAGDANHDRHVDVTDLGILATNWQATARTFGQGDFNYDGVVDVSDLGILATNWQKSLPAPPVGAASPRAMTKNIAFSGPLTGLNRRRSARTPLVDQVLT